MTKTLMLLTARQLVGRRRTVLIALVAVVPIGIALLVRLAGDPESSETARIALDLVSGLIFGLLLPVVALVLGTAALGAEIEDGTAVFLLTKPIARWRIVLVKMGVAAGVTATLVVPATIATVAIIHAGLFRDGLALGLGLSALVGSALYASFFVALSAVTSRALVFGLAYVFVWEGILTNVFSGLSWLSLREYAFGWSDLVITLRHGRTFHPELGVAAAVIATLVALVLIVWWGTRSLSRFQIGKSD